MKRAVRLAASVQALGLAAVSGFHLEDEYGRALAFEKVPGVGPCQAVEVVGKRLYAIGQGNLYVLDIALPDEPKLLGKISGLGNTRQIFVRDAMAYITARQDGLWLVDLSDDALPKIISHYDTVEMATGIWVSDPAAPVRVSGVKFPASCHISNDMWAAKVGGNHCVVADTWNGLFVVNIADIAKPKIVANAVLPIPAGREEPDPVGGLALGEGVLYAAGIFSGLYVVSAPGMAQPVVVESDRAPRLPAIAETVADHPDFVVYRPEGQVRSVTVCEDVAWVACGVAGIHAVRIAKNSLEPATVTDPGGGVVFHVSVSGDRVFSAESSGGLGIYEIGPDLSLTEIGRLRLERKNVKQVVCPPPGRFALLHCGSNEVLIADVSDPARPKIVFRDGQVGLFYGDQLVPEMLRGRFLVAHWHRSGPAWYDVSGPKPLHIGNSPDEQLYSWTDGACAFGDRLLIVKRGRLQILDPGDLRDAGALPAFGVAGHHLGGRPSTNGKRLALARRHEQRVQVLDVSAGEKPVHTEEYRLSGHPGACGFWRDRLLIPAGYQGLLLERRPESPPSSRGARR